MISDEANDDFYINEYGKCAYLAGAVRVITDNFNMALHQAGIHHEDVESDVFCISECDENIIREMVKTRIRERLTENMDEKSEQEITGMVISESDKYIQEILLNFYKDKEDIDSVRLSAAIKEYIQDTGYFLGKPKRVYKAERESIKMCGILAEVYIGIIFDIVFVEYEKHLLMFLRGTTE